MKDFPPTSALKLPISDALAASVASALASAVAERLAFADTPVLKLSFAFESAAMLTDGEVTKKDKKVVYYYVVLK